ncbi:MAG: DUF2436 domain-containing protein [Muribaculaceae bacterium]|nr:DUF2436 domain-containing protein [Muribaculaceae bacterium]
MKKITLMLLVALILPLTMNAETKTYVQLNKKADKAVVSTPTAVKATKTVKFVGASKADIPEGYASVTLTAGDVWQDGTGYQMLLDEDATAYGSIIPEQGGLTTSGDASAEVYAEFEYKIPENADGALSTTNIVLDASVTILIPAGTYDWCITNPTPGDRLWIASSNGSIGGRADDFEFVSGVGYEFVVSLGGSNDQVDLVVDDPTAPAIPTDVTVDAESVDGTSAKVAWVPGENNNTWNLRWRPWTDPALQNRFWDLPYDGYEDQIEGWMIYDADGDGNGWQLYFTDDDQTDLCFSSASYDGGALSPDNWLFTPEVPLGGTLKFDVWNYSSSYLDKIMVYVCDNPEWESVDEFVAISDFIEPGTNPESIELDLSDYEGMGVIAFRHYDCTDKWRLFIDNIAVEIPGAQEPAEWTLCENVESPYTIEGLMPETKYETQVQGVGADGRMSDWTKSVEFTPVAVNETGMDEFYVVGTFNDWNQTEEGGRIALVEGDEGVYTGEVELEANAEFKVITPAETEGEWIWFGGVDENGVGYFLINEGLLDNPISLCDGANFRIEEGGKYTISVQEPARGLNEPLVMIITKNMTGISTVGTDKTDNAYYNLLGVKFNSMPTTPGIYIHNGKKVIIK